MQLIDKRWYYSKVFVFNSLHPFHIIVINTPSVTIFGTLLQRYSHHASSCLYLPPGDLEGIIKINQPNLHNLPNLFMMFQKTIFT